MIYGNCKQSLHPDTGPPRFSGSPRIGDGADPSAFATPATVGFLRATAVQLVPAEPLRPPAAERRPAHCYGIDSFYRLI